MVILILLVLGVINYQLKPENDQLRADIDSLNNRLVTVERSHKGGTKLNFFDYDINTALMYLENGEDEKLLRYCEINDLDYTALIDLLVTKGYLQPVSF